MRYVSFWGGAHSGQPPMEQKPDLYSTAGSIGMKVVSEPADAAIEYV